MDITISPEKSAELLKKINLCFLFAQNYHIAMKYVAPIRKELGIRTVFNILGPLSNPAGANMELMGVFDETLVAPLAQVMMKLGVKRGMVVYGQDKLDEISMCGPDLRLRESGTAGSSPTSWRRSSSAMSAARRRSCRAASGGKRSHHQGDFKWKRQRPEAPGRLPERWGGPLYCR